MVSIVSPSFPRKGRRAARLVVDTGLHSKRWSREKATGYLVATAGFARPRSQREVERYCAQPGQACRRFDLKPFHELLKDGAMPLVILDQGKDGGGAGIGDKNPPRDFAGRGTMRSMVEGLFGLEEPLHRTSSGPPPAEIRGRN